MPRSVTGKEQAHPPRKDRHMEGFEKALQKALNEAADTWDEATFKAKVTFEISGTKNPGAVPEYRVTLTEL